MYSGTAGAAVAANFQQSQDTLYALAGDTGGKALLDYNDLAKGIAEAEKSVSSYYILGYYTTNTEQNGKFRHIKLTLNPNVAVSLDYRQGYTLAKCSASSRWPTKSVNSRTLSCSTIRLQSSRLPWKSTTSS